MTTINLLPENLKSQQRQKVLGRSAFLAAFAFLAVTLAATLAVISYEQVLKRDHLSLGNRKKTEEATIQSLKDTEGIYRSLMAKTKVLAYALNQRKDVSLVFTQVKALGNLTQIKISGFSLVNEKLVVLGNTPDYESLSSFLEQMMTLNEPIKLTNSVLKNINQEEQKGQIEFTLETDIL